MDSHQLLTSRLPSRNYFECGFDPPKEEKRREFALRIEQATATDELPFADDLKCLSKVKVLPRLGIADPCAAFRIGLDRSNGLFAMLPQTALYHRPWCPDVLGREELRLRMIPQIDGEEVERTPCPNCLPENWDFDALTGEDSALGP
jgi:hypothetical protein